MLFHAPSQPERGAEGFLMFGEAQQPPRIPSYCVTLLIVYMA